MNLYNKGTQTSRNIISNTVIDLPLSYREIAALLNDDNLTIGIDKLKVGFHVENMTTIVGIGDRSNKNLVV